VNPEVAHGEEGLHIFRGIFTYVELAVAESEQRVAF
jgi:hypothetical protein